MNNKSIEYEPYETHYLKSQPQSFLACEQQQKRCWEDDPQ